MKYNGRMVVIPWLMTTLDGDVERVHSTMKFKGVVDRRRVKREVRKFFKKTLERKVHPYELHRLLKFMSVPLNAEA